MDYLDEIKELLKFEPQSFGEMTIDAVLSLIIEDLELLIIEDQMSKFTPTIKEFVSDWMKGYKLAKEQGILTHRESEFLQRRIELTLGRMPIWEIDFQEKVLSNFRAYFGEEADFYKFFESAYLKGLKEIPMRFKNCKHKNLRVEADFTDPIWCSDCDMNFELEEFPISKELIDELNSWALEYPDIYDLAENNSKDIEIIKLEHNSRGMNLKEKLQQELINTVVSSVTFRPIRL
ncbi:hypothetical protein ACFVHQ_03430 [Actinomycetes bacterium NPDC127524]